MDCNSFSYAPHMLDTTAALDGWEIVKMAGWRPAR